jgi:hypothetical protein
LSGLRRIKFDGLRLTLATLKRSRRPRAYRSAWRLRRFPIRIVRPSAGCARVPGAVVNPQWFGSDEQSRKPIAGSVANELLDSYDEIGQTEVRGPNRPSRTRDEL